jgi:hypothetical protein
MEPETSIEKLTKSMTINPESSKSRSKLKSNYTNYADELGDELANGLNLDENNRKKIKNILAKINWERHFNRTCTELLKHGNLCSAIVKPGTDYCQRHLNIRALKNQKNNPNS